MAIAPGSLITLTTVLVNAFCLVAALLQENMSPLVIPAALQSIVYTLISFYFLFFASGTLTMISERKRIKLSKWKRILYCFTFPLYIFTYIPISVAAIFKKVKWTPIEHNINKTVNDLK